MMETQRVRGLVWVSLFLMVGGPGFQAQAKLAGWRTGGETARAVTAAFGASGEVGGDTASITGSVSSSSGAKLPGTLIHLRDLQSGRVYTVISGEMGMFRVARLAAGRYELSASLAGFEPRRLMPIEVPALGTESVSVSLDPAFRVESYVTVIGNAPAASLEASEIRESFSHDLGDALGERAGVWRIRKGGIANDTVIRGLQGRDLTVLIDGQRIYGACPSNMDPATFHVDFAEVERVDITKGPFDMRNEGGLGGSLSVVTRRPVDGFRGRMNLAAGSFGLLNPSADFAYGGERFSALGGLSFRRSNPFRDGLGKRFTQGTNYAKGTGDDRAFSVGTGWGRLALALTDSQNLSLSFARQEAGDVLYPYLQMDAEYDHANRFGFRYEAEPLSDRLTRLSIQGYYTEVSHWMTDRTRTSASGTSRGYSMGTQADTRALGSKVEAALHDWVFGFEVYQRFWGASTEMAMRQYRPQYALPDVRLTGIGAFAEYQHPLTEAVQLSAAFRLDRVESQADSQKANTVLYQAYHQIDPLSTIDGYASGTLHLDYQLPSGWEFGIGAGSTAQVPEPNERFYALMRMGADWVGNPGLRRSRNNAVDATFRLKHPRAFLEAELFHYWVNDFVALYRQPRILRLPGVMNSFARSYTNLDARLFGSEVAIVVPLLDRLLLSGDLSWVRGIQERALDRDLHSTAVAEIPPLRSRLSLRFDDGRWFGQVEGTLSAAQKRVNGDLSEGGTASWGVMDLLGGLRSGPWTMTLGIENLFDRFYYEHLSYQRDPFRSGFRVPEPGRRLSLNLAVRF